MALMPHLPLNDVDSVLGKPGSSQEAHVTWDLKAKLSSGHDQVAVGERLQFSWESPCLSH